MRARKLEEIRVYRKAMAAAGQLTDRHLAAYLGRARGSVLETIGRLSKAASEDFISRSQHDEMADTYDHIGRMLTRWIHHLQDSDWKDRG